MVNQILKNLFPFYIPYSCQRMLGWQMYKTNKTNEGFGISTFQGIGMIGTWRGLRSFSQGSKERWSKGLKKMGWNCWTLSKENL